MSLAPVWLLMASLAFVNSATAQAPTGFSGGDEFVGPFSSWANVKTVYGARGDGQSDDSDAFQRAFDEIGNPGKSVVLYVPAGTYRITRQIKMSVRRNISVLGENAANTTIKWGGPAGGEMIYLDSVPYSRFGRITWDGANSAKSLVVHGWTGVGQYGGTSYFEHADEIFKDAQFGIRAGVGGLMEGETAILRCAFYRSSKAGLSVENYNALDWYVWDSIFDSNYFGVTNTYGAGNFHIYNSYFTNSRQADVSIDATSFLAFRNNYSIGSRAFFVTSQVGSAPAPVTFQKNVILDAQTTPIQFGNPGPVTMLDNVIRSAVGQNGPAVVIAEAYTSLPSGRLVALGNTYTVPNPYSVRGEVIASEDKILDRSSVNPQPPQMPQSPTSWGRQVIEVPTGANALAIQNAINSAAVLYGSKPVVHLPAGSYRIDSTITVPANCDLQIVGDGGSPVGGSQLLWTGSGPGPVLLFAGPSRATVRDLSVLGNGSTTGILVENADQPGSRFFGQQYLSHGSGFGVLVDGLNNTEVNFHNIYLQSNSTGFKVVGGTSAPSGSAASRSSIFAGFSGDNQLTYDIGNYGYLNAQDMWYEGAPPRFLRFTDSGNFTLNGGTISAADPNRGGSASTNATVELSGYAGNFTLANVFLLTRNRISVDSSTANVLVTGVVGPPDNANFYSVTNSGAAKSALLHSRLFNNTGGSTNVSDQVRNVSSVATFVPQMLAPLRSIQPKAFANIPAGAMDLKFYRVAVDNHSVGLTLRSSGATIPVPPVTVPPVVVPPVVVLPAPTITVTSPARDAVVSGTVVFAVSPDAPSGLGSVQLKLDGASLGGLLTTAPFSTSIDTKALSNGAHQLSAEVKDLIGRSATSSITINVSNAYAGPTQPMVLGYNPQGTRIRQDSSSWFGGWFTTGGSPLTVISLGRLTLPGSTGLHKVKLVRATDSVDVPGGEVSVNAASCAAGAFCYAELPTPLVLPPSSSYYIVSAETIGGDLWYDLGAVTGNSAIRIDGAIYKEPQPGGIYQRVAVPNILFGPVNLRFASSTPSVALPTIALTSPAGSTVIAGVTTLTVGVNAAAGVGGVQYKLDGSNLGAEVTSQPFSRTLDSAIFPNGNYVLTAVVRDLAGNTATSGAVTLTINNVVATKTSFVTQIVPGTLRNNSSQWVGMNFTTGAKPITIQSLGRWCVAGNSGTHLLKLARNSLDLPGGMTTVNMAGCTPGTFQYATLSAPLTLPANTTFNFASFETAGGDRWYDMVPVQTSGIASIRGPIYWDSQVFVEVPVGGYSFVPLDFQY